MGDIADLKSAGHCARGVPFSLLLALWCNWQHDGSVVGESYSSRATL